MFASAIKLRGERSSVERIPIPGGSWTVSIAAVVGLVTTLSAIVFAGVPNDDEPDKLFAIVKVVGFTAVVLLVGAVIYLAGRGKGRSS